MKYEKFKSFIEHWQYTSNKVLELQEIGVDIYDKILDPYWGIINPLIEEVFSEKQIEIIEDFIYNDKTETLFIDDLYKKLDI